MNKRTPLSAHVGDVPRNALTLVIAFLLSEGQQTKTETCDSSKHRGHRSGSRSVCAIHFAAIAFQLGPAQLPVCVKKICLEYGHLFQGNRLPLDRFHCWFPFARSVRSARRRLISGACVKSP